MTRIGFILHKNGDWPFTESVVNKVWKHTVELLSRHYDVEVYQADGFRIDSGSRKYRNFINNIQLLWFLQPYHYVDRVNGVPAVIYSLGSMQKGAYWLFFNRESYRQSDSLVFNCSSCMRIYNTIVHGRRLQTYLMPFGVDETNFHPRDKMAMRRKYGIPPDKFVLLYAGRLSPEKNIDALLRVLKALLPSHPNLHLVLAGGLDNFYVRDGVEYPNMGETLRKQMTDLDLHSRVQILGYRNQPTEVAEIMSAADIGVNFTTAIGENFGYSQVEYQACGLPVICSDYAALQDTVQHGVSGFRIHTSLTSKGVSIDEVEAKQYIAQLIKSPATLERLRANALVNARRYSLEVFASSLAEIAESTLEKAHGEQKTLTPDFNPRVEAFYNQISRQYGESHFADLTSLPFPEFYSGLGKDVSKLFRQDCVTTAGY